MNEKISNKLLAIPIAISFSVIALFCFFCIGLSKVDAQVPDYNWNSPRLIGLSTSNNILDESAFLVSGTDSNSITYNSNVWGGTNVYIRYRAVDSDQGTTYLALGTYSFSYKVTFRLIGTNSIAKITPKLHYYPNNSNTYGTATCDTTPTMILTQTGTDPTTYEFTYSCSTFNVTTNVSWFAVGFETSIPMNYVSMIQNLKFTGPSDTQDIINNQTQNTQDIINNQNNNTQDIINNQNQNKNEVINNNNANTDKITDSVDKNTEEQKETNQNLQDIQDALTDDTAPNLDAFDDMSGWLPPGPLDSVLNIPLNILNGLVGAFSNNTCSAISIPIPFIGGNLQLPCLYNLYSSINGLSIALTSFFTAISGYFMFKYLSNLYVWIDQTLKMEETSYMRDWGGV